MRKHPLISRSSVKLFPRTLERVERDEGMTKKMLETIRQKISLKMTGRKLSESHIQNISDGKKGTKLSEKHKENIKLARKRFFERGGSTWIKGKKHKKKSNEKNRLTQLRILNTKQKLTPEQEEIRISRIKATRTKNNSYFQTDKTKRKKRESAIKYIKKVRGDIRPNIGRNEKKILDELEQTSNYRIDRKFTVEGYFPDGYVQELNLIIEVDERPKTREKDIERENIIKKVLNCNFLRINDYV